MASQFGMVFPGQGSQSVGMLADIAASFPMVKELFAQASDILGYDLWQLVQENPNDKLNQTEFTQPAVLTVDVALWQCWQSKGAPDPTMVAGHSLGEYSALVCAQALTFADAVDLVAKRGHYMQAAVNVGEGAMAAIIGLENSQVENLCESVAKEGEVLSPANFNSVGQVVIAGHKAAVERLLPAAKENGAKIAKLIPVSVPSHCALMQPAVEQLKEDLERVTFSTPKIKVVHNADVKSYSSASEIKAALVKQLIAPVRWVETIQFIAKQGISVLVECGPGKVLTGLNKRIDRSVVTYPTATPDDLSFAMTNVME